MTHKIPGTNLELSDEEIEAVIEYSTKLREELLKKYKVNTGRTFDKKGRPPLPNPNSIFVKKAELRDENGKINISIDDINPIYIKY